MKIYGLTVALSLGALIGVRAESSAAPADVVAQKLAKITINFDFLNASIDQAVYFLQVESKRMDPAHKALNVVISPGAVDSARPVTMQGTTVTLEQALGGVCAAAGVKYQLDGGVIRILSSTEIPVDAKPEISPDDKAAQATWQLLQATVIDKINFEKLDIAAALKFLTFRSKSLDPNRLGISFVAADFAPSDNIHRLVTLRLEGLPLSDVLKYLASQTNLHYSIGDNIVTFKP